MDVTMQGYRIELSQDRDLLDIGMKAIAHGNINKSIFPGKWHSGFGSISGKRI
jgi:hypothetical protein